MPWCLDVLLPYCLRPPFTPLSSAARASGRHPHTLVDVQNLGLALSRALSGTCATGDECRRVKRAHSWHPACLHCDPHQGPPCSVRRPPLICLCLSTSYITLPTLPCVHQIYSAACPRPSTCSTPHCLLSFSKSLTPLPHSHHLHHACRLCPRHRVSLRRSIHPTARRIERSHSTLHF